MIMIGWILCDVASMTTSLPRATCSCPTSLCMTSWLVSFAGMVSCRLHWRCNMTGVRIALGYAPTLVCGCISDRFCIGLYIYNGIFAR